MEHWGIYIAYAWLATIIYAFMDAVQAIRKGPQLQPSEAIPPQQLGRVSTEVSKEMLGLLKELSVYKAMDDDYLAGSRGKQEVEASEQREQRRQEIREQMHQLAAQSKKDHS